MPRKLDNLDKSLLKKYGQERDAADELTAEFSIRLRANDDEATITLVGHLMLENLLDRIIQKNFKSPNTILNDSRSYPFSVKLQIIYSSGLVPVHIFNNIARINRFRNKFAHNMDVDIDPQLMIIDIENDTVEHPDAKNKRKNRKKEYFKILCYATIKDLAKHMIQIGVDPRRVSDEIT